MHILTIRTFFLLTAIALGSASAETAETSVSGTWAVQIESKAQTRETSMQLLQVGTKITGYIVSAATGAQAPITGTVVGTKITFSYPVLGLRVVGGPENGGNAVVNYTGSVAGDRITAKASPPLLGDFVLSATLQKK